MRHGRLMLPALTFLASWHLACRAAGEVRTVSAVHDFEAADTLTLTASEGKHRVNFKGLSEEQVLEGKKSLKIDVTFETSGYVWFSIPVAAPAEGNLTFTGSLFVDPATTTGRIGFTPGLSFPPTNCAIGYTPMNTNYRLPKQQWATIARDLAEVADLQSAQRLDAVVWGVEPGNVGRLLKDVGVVIAGSAGQRGVVYVDAIRVAGEVPTPDAYAKIVTERWAPAAARTAAKLAAWDTALAQADSWFRGQATPAGFADFVTDAAARLATLKPRLAALRTRGWIELSDEWEIDGFLPHLGQPLEALATGRHTEAQCLLYVTQPISPIRILPTDRFIPGVLSGPVTLTAAPGEFESASLVVAARRDLAALEIKVSDLRNGSAVIPADRVSVRYVKCWYQAGTAWQNYLGQGNGQQKDKRVLVPELLLRDDALVTVDLHAEKNYLRLRFPTEEKRVWISDPAGGDRAQDRPSTRDFPFRDSPVPLPTDLATGTNKQVWLTLSVPETAPAGRYQGTVVVTSRGAPVGELPMTVTVLPFTLAAPATRYDPSTGYAGSLFYPSWLDPKRPEGAIAADAKSREQLRAELRDLLEHGVTHITCYQPVEDPALLAEYLSLCKEAGLPQEAIYFIRMQGNDSSRAPLDVLKKAMAVARSAGYREVWFYGADEATGDRLLKQRAAWEAIHGLGAKVLVAGYVHESFPLMGDIQDLLICAGYPDAKEAARWHGKGHKIWMYAFPQAGPENPELYRRTMGLLTWRHDYDGVGTWAYQSGTRHIWNDFDDDANRDFNLTYPTADGVVDTLAFEGFREGIDDVRYATTLRLEIEKAKTAADPGRQRLAAAAQAYLDGLGIESGVDLAAVRTQMVEFILKLKE